VRAFSPNEVDRELLSILDALENYILGVGDVEVRGASSELPPNSDIPAAIVRLFECDCVTYRVSSVKTRYDSSEYWAHYNVYTIRRKKP
jgi:hypothetical protein